MSNNIPNWLKDAPSIEELRRLPDCCLQESSNALLKAGSEAMRAFYMKAFEGGSDEAVEAAIVQIREEISKPTRCTHTLSVVG